MPANTQRILLLGASGKMGCALAEKLRTECTVLTPDRNEFDAADFANVRALVERHRPDVVINTVAHLGIEPSEDDPQRAFRLNALYPRLLAELSNERDFTLVHFSTDAVFSDREMPYTEDDVPQPVNVYGMTKHAGDVFVQTTARRHYIARISVLFGPTTRNAQFVEKMLERIATANARGERAVLRIADDIVCSPCYSRDVAAAVAQLLRDHSPFGVYHLANAGRASLYELMNEIVRELGLNADVKRASYRDFPARGRKNLYTPLTTHKRAPMRAWRDAIPEYCHGIKQGSELQQSGHTPKSVLTVTGGS